ncbi:MAG: NAD/NADP octopine/nopaline dehydrogenase family protein [Planctomycetia bacterium]|nr:NAD/NADP octopine/nopaline dehydrogenase family protein [Planctomycetia bacterium]
MKIVICGGGNISHALAGFLASNPLNEVSVLTRKPHLWSREITVFSQNGTEEIRSTLRRVTSDDSVIQKADVVFVSLPCFARHEVLLKVQKNLPSHALVVVIPGVGGANFEMETLFKNPKVCYFHRTPYVSRIIEYGKSVQADKKQYCSVYFSSNCTTAQRKIIQELNIVETREFYTPWLLTLSNSNPIIHIARLCEIHHTQPHEECPLFYAEWGNDASELAIKMDEELKQILQRLNASQEFVPLLTYYESSDTESLTRKINSILPLHTIPAPMMKQQKYWEIDSTSRYLTEDLPYGTCFIKFMAQTLGLNSPFLDKSIRTLQKYLNECFVDQNGFLSEETFMKYISPSIIQSILLKYKLKNNLTEFVV